jgi:predicted anti-sigma-YlaC factor YlaD
MRCSRAVQQLQLYIDRQLPLHKIRELEIHLSSCPACRNELFLLEQIEQALNSIEAVAEPSDLTLNIMRRVALSAKQEQKVSHEEKSFTLFRPSLSELLAAVLLATVATFGIILGQPSLRALLPLANGHDGLSLALMTAWTNILATMNINTLMLVFWVFGTILGIWITLILAGSEVRTIWFKAIQHRLPVW